MTDIRGIERMTPYEFELRVTAFKLRKLDQEYDFHLQAWLGQQVQATKKLGKKEVPYFKDFNAFFNYQKREQEILGLVEDTPDSQFAQLMRKANG
ncbi:hypothetical protein [uncultured Vagococcus sp.]|uniref:hypothetical protein n=1 Tax=uncultured Vagococcus sp. TaxID=189676 RepID=UPI0028D11A33|nr:hypothetical protein [uncultured Vagococcus sp.]